MIYEGVLLFGVFVITGLVFGVLVQQRHALYHRHGLSAVLFVVTGIYFIWQWSRGGQTLAMKTWRIRIVDGAGQHPNVWRATLRYLLSWLWILPGLATAWLLGAQGWMLVLIPAANVLLWGLTGRLDSDRQLLHDRLAGTRLIRLPRPGKN